MRAGRQGIIQWFTALAAAEQQPSQPLIHVPACPRRNVSTLKMAKGTYRREQEGRGGHGIFPTDSPAGVLGGGGQSERVAEACVAAAQATEASSGVLTLDSLREKLYIRVLHQDLAWIEVDVYRNSATKLVLQNPLRTFYFSTRVEGGTAVVSVSHSPPPEMLTRVLDPKKDTLSGSDRPREETGLSNRSSGGDSRLRGPTRPKADCRQDDSEEIERSLDEKDERKFKPAANADLSSKRVRIKSITTTIQLPSLSFSFLCATPSLSSLRFLGVYVNPREATGQLGGCPSQFILALHSLNASITSRFVLPSSLLGGNRSARNRRHALSVRHLGCFSIQGLHVFNFGPSPTCFPVVLGPAAYSLAPSAFGKFQHPSNGVRQPLPSFSIAEQAHSLPHSWRPVGGGCAGTSRGLSHRSVPAGDLGKPGVHPALQIQMVVSSKRQQGYPGMYPFLVYIHQSIEELKIGCAPLVVNLDMHQLLRIAAGLLDSLQAVGSPLLLQLQTRPFEMITGCEAAASPRCLWSRDGESLGCTHLHRQPRAAAGLEECGPAGQGQRARKDCKDPPFLGHSQSESENFSDAAFEANVSLWHSSRSRSPGVLDGATSGQRYAVGPLSNLPSFSSFFLSCFAPSSVATFGPFLTPPASSASNRSRCVVDSISIAPIVLSLSVVFDTLLQAAEVPSGQQHAGGLDGVILNDEAVNSRSSHLVNLTRDRETVGNGASDSGNLRRQETENTAFTRRLFSLFLRSLNVENAVVKIGSFSSDYMLLPLPVLQFFFSQHLQQQLKEAATTAVLSTDGLLNVGAWKGRVEAIARLFLTDCRTGSPAEHESRVSRKKEECNRRKQPNDMAISRKWREGSLQEYLGQEADIALKHLLSTVDAAGTAGAIILEGIADAVSRAFGLYGATALSVLTPAALGIEESRSVLSTCAPPSSPVRTLQRMLPAVPRLNFSEEVQAVQRLPPPLLLEGFVRGWIRLVEDCGQAVGDFIRSPVLALYAGGLSSLPSAVVSGALSLIVKPLVGMCEFIALAASGLQQQLHQRQTQLTTPQQVALQQLLLIMRGSTLMRGVAPSPVFNSGSLGGCDASQLGDEHLHLGSSSRPATIVLSPSVAVKIPVFSTYIGLEVLALPRMLYGPERVLRLYDSRDAFVQLILFQIGSLQSLPFVAHALDRRPVAAVGEVAQAVSIVGGQSSAPQETYWAAVNTTATAPRGVLRTGDSALSSRNDKVSGAMRHRHGGLFLLLLMGSSCYVVVGWPLVVLLSFPVKNISSLHCLRKSGGASSVSTENRTQPRGGKKSSRASPTPRSRPAEKATENESGRRRVGEGDRRNSPEKLSCGTANRATGISATVSGNAGSVDLSLASQAKSRKTRLSSNDTCRLVLCVSIDSELERQVNQCTAAVSAASEIVSSSLTKGSENGGSRGGTADSTGTARRPFGGLDRMWQGFGFKRVTLREQEDQGAESEHAHNQPAATHRLFWVVDVLQSGKGETSGREEQVTSKPKKSERTPRTSARRHANTSSTRDRDGPRRGKKDLNALQGADNVPAEEFDTTSETRGRSSAYNQGSSEDEGLSRRTTTSRGSRWMIIQLNAVDEDKAHNFKKAVSQLNRHSRAGPACL
ncbi:amine-terminal region of a tm vesicle-mediated sorter [Cystoisospora suis]|uniref:Amine-terminal region of a tm vesicle-mediated sorter n=1 Tax=Cystoisospora suis TaxID=483139 RepID=A0A2C6L159_9APIC|nr:amine-terminal region of a tm vesicle-mediated sorter [Cystoisospora suis]